MRVLNIKRKSYQGLKAGEGLSKNEEDLAEEPTTTWSPWLPE